MSNDIQKDEPESGIIFVTMEPKVYDSPPLSAITYDECSQWENPRKEVLAKYYQKIIDSQIQFTRVMRITSTE